jgi:signal transduction histidine kinase
MKNIRWARVLFGWLSTVKGAALTALGITGAFVGLHLLGQGTLRELRYALAITAAGLIITAAISLLRYAGRYIAMRQALENLPLEEAALPRATNQAERDFRALADGYRLARDEAVEHAAQAERERLDYFTLWVHQIKTPISALDLMAQSDDTIDNELLRQEVFKIGQYADAALAFQRLQSLPNDLALSKVSLYPLCCSVVRQLRPIFMYRAIALCMEPFDSTALSDPKWLGMALTQVLTNALKYTPAGGRITIVLREPQVLTVSDTGLGIGPEDLPRVFERGFTGRVGRLEREGEKSTGIGLYLCKQACDKLKHHVSIASRLGEGTTVTFDLRRERYETYD